MRIIFLTIMCLLWGITSSQDRQVSDTIQISYIYNVSIIFNETIQGNPFFGSSVALNSTKDADQTIMIKADGQWMAEHNTDRIATTNMTVRTTNHLYNFILTYAKQPERTVITPDQYQPVYTFDKELAIPDTSAYVLPAISHLATLKEEKPNISGIGVRHSRYGIDMEVPNIWVDEEYLYLKLVIRNRSSTPYAIDYFRYVTSYDKWELKRSANPIEDKTPMMSLKGSETQIGPGKHYENVLVFQKFTLNQKEFLNIQVGEEQGARQLTVPVSWKDLLHAETIHPTHR